ncbi:hypothetical protein [Pseudomonas sp. LP_7_YM]|uniref:hypothetical protein n=1 Tax=Pseudomonas sp. LP_7_YM TaxID=2485137 RepID=UPI00105E96C2|nr:hypothetical protein [Pseudomonas sp. LP_7_YM]TDV70273.1 hypothetical protein EC915_102538 [Pseudomonas sp. LP_7_YM]
MNRFLRRLALFSLAGLLTGGLAQAGDSAAQSPQSLASASYPNRTNNTPDNGAIRRANPNSRQGTESISPTLRGPNLSPAPQRAPTLENGGIGNGYPTRQQSPRPSSGNERGSN